MADLRLRLGLDADLGAALRARGGVLRKSRRIRGQSAAPEEEEWADAAERGGGGGWPALTGRSRTFDRDPGAFDGGPASFDRGVRCV
jgi:hypothetical protein